MRHFMHDRVSCLDCGQTGWVPTRWYCDGQVPRCPHCQSIAVRRQATPWTLLRDAFFITTAG
jgi:NAD-dependent SIR2 family protein deacetylase